MHQRRAAGPCTFVLRAMASSGGGAQEMWPGLPAESQVVSIRRDGQFGGLILKRAAHRKQHLDDGVSAALVKRDGEQFVVVVNCPVAGLGVAGDIDVHKAFAKKWFSRSSGVGKIASRPHGGGAGVAATKRVGAAAR